MKNKKVISYFDIPERQYIFRATVTDLFDFYSQGQSFVNIDNLKIFIDGKWVKVLHFRGMGICFDEKSLKDLNLKCEDVIEFNAVVVNNHRQFGGIQKENGYAVRLPYCKATTVLPLDYKGKITVKIGETIYLRQTKKRKYRFYLIILDRKSFDKDIDIILTPAFMEPSETNDGYFRLVEELSFDDKRIDILGKYKKISSNEN